jgi:hypothetical protein
MLVHLKDLGLKLLKHVINDVLGEISTFLVGHSGVLGRSETPLKDLQATFVISIQALKVLDLLFVFLPETHYLVEEDCRFLFCLNSVDMIIIKLVLEECAHLGELLVTLSLQRLNEVS